MPTLSTGARLFVALCSLFFIGAGCRGTGQSPAEIRSTSSTAEIGPEGVTCRHEYYPLVPGYRALYQTSREGVSMGTYTMEVPWVRNNEAYLVTDFVTPAPGATVHTDQQMRCHNGALEAKGYADTGTLQPGGSNYNKVEIHTNSVVGSFFPETIRPGMTWESKITMTMTPKKQVDAFAIEANSKPTTITVLIHKHAVGIETVDLPIGRREAMKIEVTASFEGLPTFSKTEWWAKDIGMVKSLSRGSAREEDPVTLTEIQDYVVPGIGGYSTGG